MADEETTPTTPALAGLDAQRARIKARQAATPRAYDCPHSGLRYTFRVANGHDVDAALSLARKGDEYNNDRYLATLINRLSVEPKITSEYWALLGEDDPKVKGGLTRAFLQPSGLLPEALVDAKKPSGETEN